jgi:hypothetical protein
LVIILHIHHTSFFCPLFGLIQQYRVSHAHLCSWMHICISISMITSSRLVSSYPSLSSSCHLKQQSAMIAVCHPSYCCARSIIYGIVIIKH